VNYADLIKKLVVPAGFQAPRTLTHEDLVAEALGRLHLRVPGGAPDGAAVHYSNREIPSGS
jgi:hypothetical protein